ncbi:DUF445 family protein [Desertibacillus haloalkaliphilus]|nr:DUF445 family protein [Desertibacillus haloalkaliphilus]
MITIGAIIGGFTNSLAIKMLFRPYVPVYIGKWRVPFTPGLIPKRRGELADQLGKMVVTHLLTPEGIRKKLMNASFVREMTNWAQEEVRTLLTSEQTIQGLATEQIELDDVRKRLEDKTCQFIDQRVERFLDQIRDQKLADVIPDNYLTKADELVPKAAELICERGVQYFSSTEGKEKLSEMIDRFLHGRGTLGNMVSMFLGNDRLVDKVQPEVIKLLEDRSTQQTIEQLLQKEWAKVKEMKVSAIEQKINKEEVISFLKTKVITEVPIFEWIEEPFSKWTSPYQKTIIEDWVPKGIELLKEVLSGRLEDMMKKIHLDDVVKEQVEAFSVERLEDMVLSISRREFKMITYLGALLGGSIGFIQGLLVLFI